MPDTAEPVPIAKGAKTVYMLPGMANRHGLIAGATGTGKTTTLRVLAENFSSMGVPVFMADIKGDLSGMVKPGGDNPKIVEGLLSWDFRAFFRKAIRSRSGMSMVKPAFRSGRRYRRWDPFSLRVFWI